MLTSIDRMRHAQIWDLLGEYADIRGHLEETFHSLCSLKMSLELEMNDLSDELDDLQEELNNVSLKLFRFKGPAPEELQDEDPFPSGLTPDGPDIPDDQLLFFEDGSRAESPFPWDEDHE